MNSDGNQVIQPAVPNPGKSRPKPGNRPICISFLAPVNNQSASALAAAFAHVIKDGYDEVHLLLSSPGGGVADGIAVYNFVRALPIVTTVYNIGTVDSIANVIFQAGHYRIASPTSRFMFHGVGFEVRQARFELKDVRERAKSIENDQSMITDILVRHTALTKVEVDELFLEAAFVLSTDAQQRGIVDEVVDIHLPPGIPIIQLVFDG